VDWGEVVMAALERVYFVTLVYHESYCWYYGVTKINLVICVAAYRLLLTIYLPFSRACVPGGMAEAAD
jgi:hypothetical protein